MNDDVHGAGGPGTLFSAWLQAAQSFWQSLHGEGGRPADPEADAPRSTETQAASWADPLAALRFLQSWQSTVQAAADPQLMAALARGALTAPEILIQISQSGWKGFFELQRQWQERWQRLGRPTEAFRFEDLDKEVLTAWSNFYEQEVSRFLKVPQVGLTRFYQERLNTAIDRYQRFQAALGEFLKLMGLPVEKSLKVVQEQLGQMAEDGKLPESFRDYYQMWLKTLEGHYMALYQSSEYQQVMARTLAALEGFLAARQAIWCDLLKSLPVPTHEEMDELYRDIYLMKKRLKRLEKQMAPTADA